MTTARIAQLLRESFADSPLPAAVVEDPSHCSSCEQLHRGLRGNTWSAVPGDVLDELASHNAVLEPAAFVYYLPAFLSRALEAPMSKFGASDSVDFMIQSLCDPDLPVDEWWVERARLLTPTQNRAVATWLTWAADLLSGDPDEDTLCWQARSGLARYWGAALGDQEV